MKNAAFPTTDWRNLDAMKQAGSAEEAPLLDLLARQYWSPVFCFFLYQGVGEMDAQDATQDFFAFALQSHLFTKAEQSKGKFRSFVLTALKNFLANRWRRENANKRGGGKIDSIEALKQDAYFQPSGLIDKESPDSVFHHVWMRDVVSSVLKTLDIECQSSGKTTHYQLFRARVVAPELDGVPPKPLQELADELGLEYKQAANQLVTAKRAFQKLMLAEVRRYEKSDAASESEWQEIATHFHFDLRH